MEYSNTLEDVFIPVLYTMMILFLEYYSDQPAEDLMNFS